MFVYPNKLCQNKWFKYLTALQNGGLLRIISHPIDMRWDFDK